MKRIATISAIILLITTSMVNAQHASVARAARSSFASASDSYKKGRYSEAARDFEIVITSIPAETDSRRNLEMRLESLVKLLDIYYARTTNLTMACQTLQMFYDTMYEVRNKGILRSNDLLAYQRRELDFDVEYAPKCENFKNLDRDMIEFKKKFDEEFE